MYQVTIVQPSTGRCNVVPCEHVYLSMRKNTGWFDTAVETSHRQGDIVSTPLWAPLLVAAAGLLGLLVAAAAGFAQVVTVAVAMV